MSFTRQHFLRYKPWLYHFTHPDNLDLLRKEVAILSTATWVRRANLFEPGQVPNPYAFLGEPRIARHPLRVGARASRQAERPIAATALLQLL